MRGTFSRRLELSGIQRELSSAEQTYTPHRRPAAAAELDVLVQAAPPVTYHNIGPNA